MKLTELRVNHIKNPLGFQMDTVSFSWKVEECKDSKKQKYARIIVWEYEKIIFDSKEDENANSMDYPVKLELKPRTKYEWSVEVTGDNGEYAAAKSWFETGKMKEDWKAKWISPCMDSQIPPMIEKKFQIEKNVKDTKIYICGLGVYEVYINNQKVGNEYLAPGYHSYDFHLQVQTYDIGQYLIEGENSIQVMLGEGWFKGRLGFDGGFTNLYGDGYYLISELHVKYENKTTLFIGTDETWKCKPSPVTFSNIYDGEIYDGGMESCEDWQAVIAKEPANCGPLFDRYSLPIVKKEILKVKEVIQTPKGETVLDFGQNITGWVEFDCEIPEGKEIELTASEIMQNGCFYHENYRTAKTEFIYISKGEKAHVRPHFTFYGFRYMKVQCDFKINPEDFSAYHLRSDFDQIGYIDTGNKKVNQLFSNALWCQKDNFLDVPTDCPQRDERLGWTGDAQIFSDTACFNMYMPAFYRKYLWDMRAEQSILGGSVPNVVPRLKQGIVAEHGACPWADAGVIIPWNVYLHYGSKTLLAETYQGMKDWIEYERRREESLKGPHLIKDGFHFADWLALDNEQPGPFGKTDPLFIASGYYYHCTQIVAKAAEILGFQEDAITYNRLAKEILKDIKDAYFDDNGLCICKTQTGAALTIEFGLMPEMTTQEGDLLQKRVADNQGHLDTGFVGTPILCPALTRTGNYKTAVDLFLKEDYPGWLYSVNLGATTIWERWNSVMPDGILNSDGMNSLNHYSYGSIEAWMYRDVCGLHPLEEAPGFRRAYICPHGDKRLGYARAELQTAAGKYISGWSYDEKENITYEITIPFHATAMVQLPKGRYLLNQSKLVEDKFELTSGSYIITQNQMKI